MNRPMLQPRPRLAAGRNSEAGSATIFLLAIIPVVVILLGLVYDGGEAYTAHTRALNLAEQAARTGAQEVQGSTAIRGEELRFDLNAAKAAAQDYLRAAGVEGTVTVVDGDTLIVRTTDTYDSKFLGIIGLDSMNVTGEASARLIRTQGGIER